MVTRLDFPPARVCTKYTLLLEGHTRARIPRARGPQNTASRSPAGSASTVRLEIVPLFNLAIARVPSIHYSCRMSAPMRCATLAVEGPNRVTCEMNVPRRGLYLGVAPAGC